MRWHKPCCHICNPGTFNDTTPPSWRTSIWRISTSISGWQKKKNKKEARQTTTNSERWLPLAMQKQQQIPHLFNVVIFSLFQTQQRLCWNVSNLMDMQLLIQPPNSAPLSHLVASWLSVVQCWTCHRDQGEKITRKKFQRILLRLNGTAPTDHILMQMVSHTKTPDSWKALIGPL